MLNLIKKKKLNRYSVLQNFRIAQRKAETYFQHTESTFSSETRQSMKRQIVAKVPLVVWLLSDVSYSDECRTKKYFQYAENMFPLFFAILIFFNHGIFFI